MPAGPRVVLQEVMDQWCEAAGESGEKNRLTVGLLTLRELILQRSATAILSSRCSWLYERGSYDASGAFGEDGGNPYSFAMMR